MSPNSADPYGLERFVRAQEHDYATALAEIRSGQKRSHWMWYIFPQYRGLGHSEIAQHYAIKSVDEARAYLEHPALGTRLLECVNALLHLEGRTAHQIFGSPDDLKLRSCATLFAHVAPSESAFERLLDKYYDGQRDHRTLELLGLKAC